MRALVSRFESTPSYYGGVGFTFGAGSKVDLQSQLQDQTFKVELQGQPSKSVQGHSPRSTSKSALRSSFEVKFSTLISEVHYPSRAQLYAESHEQPDDPFGDTSTHPRSRRSFTSEWLTHAEQWDEDSSTRRSSNWRRRYTWLLLFRKIFLHVFEVWPSTADATYPLIVSTEKM